MSHMQEAYEALVEKLKNLHEADNKSHRNELDKQIHYNHIIQKILMDFIVAKHGINIMLNLAGDIDERIEKDKLYPTKYGMQEFVEIEYEEETA